MKRLNRQSLKTGNTKTFHIENPCRHFVLRLIQNLLQQEFPDSEDEVPAGKGYGTFSLQKQDIEFTKEKNTSCCRRPEEAKILEKTGCVLK